MHAVDRIVSEIHAVYGEQFAKADRAKPSSYFDRDSPRWIVARPRRDPHDGLHSRYMTLSRLTQAGPDQLSNVRYAQLIPPLVPDQ
jgi:hypothetical protein